MRSHSLSLSPLLSQVTSSRVRATSDMDQNVISEERVFGVLRRKPGQRSKEMGVLNSKDRRSLVINWNDQLEISVKSNTILCVYGQGLSHTNCWLGPTLGFNYARLFHQL